MRALPFTFGLALALGAAVVAQSAPASVNDAAGATPMQGQNVYKAFHEKAGVERVVAGLVELYKTDPRIKDIFAAADTDHLKTMLTEQFCYILGGPVHYTGLDMKKAHKDMGVQVADFNALVQDLQIAMDREHVPFWAQNRLLAKLAPMERQVVSR